MTKFTGDPNMVSSIKSASWLSLSPTGVSKEMGLLTMERISRTLSGERSR